MEKPAILVALLFIRLGLTANQVTVISLIIACSGCIFLALGDYFARLLGLSLILLWQLLDDVDGHIASTLKMSTPIGAFLDNSGGHFVYAGLYVAMGCGLAIRPDQAMVYVSRLIDSSEMTSLLVLACGALASISVTLRAVISYRYLEVVSDIGPTVAASNPAEDRLTMIRQWYRWFHLNFLEFPGFLIPLLLVTSVGRMSSLILLIYALCGVGDLILNFALHARNLVNVDRRDR